jgi:ABC-2 type transport system ATP-binding protein
MLELVDLHRSFGHVRALDGLGFSVPEGSLYGLVGRNGAGKTTAMRVVCGLVQPERGEVRWRGQPLDADARARIGFLPEERGLYQRMRAAEQLAYLARLHGVPRERAVAAARHWLERLGLGERADDAVERLSLGNQQRVQLAAALVHEPELLLLDEPFSGLDPIVTDVLADVLRERAAAGVAVVFSSHQLELVERLCDRVAIVDRGRTVAAGTVEELRARDGTRLLRVVVASHDGWYAGLEGVRVLEADPAQGEAVLALAAGADPQRVLDAARAAGPVTHFAEVRPSLAEIFREAVAA